MAEGFAPAQDEPAEAAVDMQVDTTLDRERRQLPDRVDQTVRVGAGRADEGNGVVVDQRTNRVHVGNELVGHGGLAQLDAEVVRTLVKRGVSGHRQHDVGVRDPSLAAPLPVHEQRVHQALGAAARHHPTRFRCVHEVGSHGDDLAFEPCRTGVHVALQDVGVAVVAEHLVQERVVLVIAGIDRAADLALVGGSVLER